MSVRRITSRRRPRRRPSSSSRRRRQRSRHSISTASSRNSISHSSSTSRSSSRRLSSRHRRHSSRSSSRLCSRRSRASHRASSMPTSSRSLFTAVRAAFLEAFLPRKRACPCRRQAMPLPLPTAMHPLRRDLLNDEAGIQGAFCTATAACIYGVSRFTAFDGVQLGPSVASSLYKQIFYLHKQRTALQLLLKSLIQPYRGIWPPVWLNAPRPCSHLRNSTTRGDVICAGLPAIAFAAASRLPGGGAGIPANAPQRRCCYGVPGAAAARAAAARPGESLAVSTCR